jgi:hypothetical protein
MWGAYLAAVLLFIAQAIAGVTAACAEELAASPQPSASAFLPPPSAATNQASPDPAVALIRQKIADPDLRKGANADDFSALEAFYRGRTGAPLWMTDMGLFWRPRVRTKS